ncbi:podocalyxin-like protein 2 [Antechinus flavipes]|uniref:podocalyxin-like protein 2 n=1 Tax=Antechinus flavipes TaxID=38775 RepID=UPI0022365038|nr:podocalyxin-like protein 2 [Antechinus flavipes]
MGRLLRAALLLTWGVSLSMCLIGLEEPGPEGLTSTSLLDLLLPSGLESVDPVEPSEAIGPGIGLGGPGSGFTSEENEESKILQPPQYFWEDEGELNDSTLDLGPTEDYTFPLSPQKSVPEEDKIQDQEVLSLSSPLPTMNLVEPPWHNPPEDLDEEEEEEEEEEAEEEEEEEEEQEEEEEEEKELEKEQEERLLPVNGSQETPQSQVPGPVSTSSTPPGSVPETPRNRHEDPVDQGVEVGSSMESSLSPLPIIPATVALGSQDFTKQEAETTVGVIEQDTGHSKELEIHGGIDEEATVVTKGPLVKQGDEFPSLSPFQRNVPSGDLFQASISASPTLDLTGIDLTSSAAATGQHDLPLQVEDGKVPGVPTRTSWDPAQVICKDWSNLAGKNYIILNMTENIDCEVFRQHRGLRLLALVEEVLPRQGDGRPGDWHISLSKPSENEQHLLMTLVGEQGVVPTKDVLSVLGDIRRSLVEIGIQNYSTTTSCQARPSQVRSDYGKLFVVLVVIGSICVIIIVLGLIYNCWQRRLPKLKNMSHGEELRFVENGCHDNPTLDVASDSQSEMQEKQPSLNGGSTVNGPGGWTVLMGGKRDPEDSDVFEEDTHL